MPGRSSQQEPQRRSGGPIGGLIKLVGSGVNAAAEYRGHRKERKAAHDSALASPEEDHVVAGPSSHQNIAQNTNPDSLPPSYSQSTQYGPDRQLATGPPAGDEKRLAENYSSDSDYSSDEQTPMEDDEDSWQLDEVAAATEPPNYEDAIKEDTDAFERDIIANRQANPAPIGTLPLPVIIPQRRPRFKSRGFVRAYSPVLQDVGIDQETFLRFLKNFHASSQANPCFDAIMVAATVAGFVPDPIVMAVTTAVQVAAGVGKEMDSRRKTNNFLDRMNETLFKPAGCYAFIMKYKPDAEIKEGGGLLARLGVKIEEVDFSASKAVAKYDAASQEGEGSSMSAKMNKMRLTSGKTMGSLKMVEAAPLIYPEIDEAIIYSGKDGQETFKDKYKDAGKFLAGYMDRKRQMDYARQDPNSALIVPGSEQQPVPKSKWADPNNPMFNGGLIGLVSGGHIDAGKHRAEKRERKLQRKEVRYERRHGPRQGNSYQDSPSGSYYGDQQQDPDYFNRSGRGGRGGRGGRREHPRDRAERRAQGGAPRGVIGKVRKVMQEDVLYLMIVPMPTEAELAEAREMIRMEKEKK